MESNSFENDLSILGIRLITPVGKGYDTVSVSHSGSEIPDTFLSENDLMEVLSKKEQLQQQYPNSFDGRMCGNPIFSDVDTSQLTIEVSYLRYFTYFALTQVAKTNPRVAGVLDQYVPLSVCGVVYDTERKVFYAFRRPEGSIEDPGKFDAAGGTLNPDDKWRADPIKTIKNRFQSKLGFADVQPHCLGVVRLTNQTYNSANIVYYAEVHNQDPVPVDQELIAIQGGSLQNYLQDPQIILPLKASLALASQTKQK